MILNTYLKNFDIILSQKHKKFLGINLTRSFRTKNQNEELKKVKIKEQGISLEVIDYPKEFLYNENTIKLVRKFLSNNGKNKKFVRNLINLPNNGPVEKKSTNVRIARNNQTFGFQIKH